MSEKYRITLMCTGCGKTGIPMGEFDKHKSECASGALHDLVAPPEGDVPDTVDGPRCAEPVARDEVICEDLQTKEDLAATSYENILNHASRLVYELDLQGDFEDAAIIAALIERSTERHAAASDFSSASKDRWENEVMGLPYEKPNNGASGRRNDLFAAIRREKNKCNFL